MKHTPLPVKCSLVVVAAMILGGCAAQSNPSSTTSCGTDYTCMKSTAFQYRQQAMLLNTLAQRYEIEADAKAKEFGQDAEPVKRQRELAKQYWSEAQRADELAHEYLSQLPHNVIN